jgi:hypothetical protein
MRPNPAAHRDARFTVVLFRDPWARARGCER